jgi:tRNA A-37 threonylcarbamoyl transferase component Bud32
MRIFSGTESEVPGALGWLEPALWSCNFLALGLLSLYALHRPKALRFNEQGLFITTRTVDGCSLEKYVAWRWLTEAALVDYGFIVKEPRLQFRTKWGGTCSISLKQASASLSEDVLLSALRKWTPNVVSQVESYFNQERQGTCSRPGSAQPGSAQSSSAQPSYTEIWFQSMHQSASYVRKRKFSGELQAGMTLRNQRYEVVKKLGRGGQATAYLVVDRDNGKQKFVLKEYVFPASENGQLLMEKRLQQEFDLLRCLSHRAIVSALETFIEDHRGYMILEYVEGVTFKHLIEKSGPLPEREVILIALQVISAIRHAHNLIPPIVHCDLTPDNLIRQTNGKLKVVDFTQTIVGKPSYMPPEQFKGHRTVQTDIYALGATLAFLLTGQEPEPLTVSRPSDKGRQISCELDDVIARATALDRETRYQSMTSICDDLKRILADSIMSAA